MSRTTARRRRGFALFLSLLLLLVLTISGVALMFNTSVEDTLAGMETKVSKTFYAADSGIEWAGANLQGGANFNGGQMPVNMYTNYASTTPSGGVPSTSTPGDISVSLSPPLFLGYTIHPKDEFQSQGSTYGTNQVVENIFAVTSTAAATSIQSQKTISAEIGVYPAQLGIH